jgi:gamma-glutamyltranspeptidase / glutathione hydrolase
MNRPLQRWASASATLIVTWALSACSTAPTAFTYQPFTQPEAASGSTAKPGWATRNFAVAAANPLATDAGYQILKAGGSAVDAAIAVQMVLGLVEPQSSGIGGGAFLLHHDGRKTQAFDGRETAPAAASEHLFMKDGKPMAFDDAVVGGRSVGVPGTLRMLELAHRQHGKLPWATLFQPAIALAEGGFAVSPRLHALIKADPHLHKDPAARAYFYLPSGQALPEGHLLRNPGYAAVLKQLASEGSVAMHQGPIAQSVVRKVQEHPSNPGALSLQDMAQYQPKERAPLCMDYRANTGQTYAVCGMPPPSSGMIAIGQILGQLAHTQAQRLPLDAQGLPSADWLHVYTESSRLAFADRAQYLGDPDFVPAPDGKMGGAWSSLLASSYLAERARLITETSMKGAAKPGNPVGVKQAFGLAQEQPEYGTSHISIVDARGNALSMTTTIEAAFGARQMVNPLDPQNPGGFLLNNELTDFNFNPNDASGMPTANRVQPGKRPRSSMSPTLVFDKASGKVVLTGGSPGGALIIHFTAKTLHGMLNWGLNAQQAIDLPNFGALGAPTFLEENRFPAATVEQLKARGHDVREGPMVSGLQAVSRADLNAASGTGPGWFGGADPRREGVVRGD